MVAGSKRTELAPVDTLRVDIPALIGRGPGPYEVDVEVAPAWVKQALAGTDAEVQQLAQLRGELSLQGKTALFRGHFTAVFEVPCARCLEGAAVDGGGELCVHFERGESKRPKLEEDDEEEIDTGSPEQFTFDGITLDLRPMLVEHLVMAYPMRALCERGEDCRGLCSQCGANLNSQGEGGPCSACAGQQAAQPPEPAGNASWQAALRKIRDKS